MLSWPRRYRSLANGAMRRPGGHTLGGAKLPPDTARKTVGLPRTKRIYNGDGQDLKPISSCGFGVQTNSLEKLQAGSRSMAGKRGGLCIGPSPSTQAPPCSFQCKNGKRAPRSGFRCTPAKLPLALPAFRALWCRPRRSGFATFFECHQTL